MKIEKKCVKLKNRFFFNISCFFIDLIHIIELIFTINFRPTRQNEVLHCWGLDDNITTVSSQHVQNIITQIIITKFNITWNIITK